MTDKPLNWFDRPDSPQHEDWVCPQTCFFQHGQSCLRTPPGEGSTLKQFRHPGNILVVYTIDSCPEAGNTDEQKRICPNDFVRPGSVHPKHRLRRVVGRSRKFAIVG